MAIEQEPLGAARTEVTESRAVRRPLRAVLFEEGVGLGERGRVRHTVGATHGGTVCRGEDQAAAVWYVLYASGRLPPSPTTAPTCTELVSTRVAGFRAGGCEIL